MTLARGQLVGTPSGVEAGLRGYDGALLVVSHDADFLDAIGIDRTIALTMNGV